MPAIVLQGFIGEQPRIVPTLLDATAAKSAVNARLDDGALTPTRAPVQVAEAGADTHQTIYRWGDTWLSWPGIVHAAPGPVATDRLYYTGDGPPKMRVVSTDYALALPMAAGALTATLGGAGAGDVTTRLYVYTWVTGFGEESEPTPASNAVDWKPGNTVTLSGFAAAPAGRNITKQRIYRSQTGQSGTYFYLIAERAAANTNYVDSIPVDQFQEPLPSADWTPPVDTLEGLTVMPNGMMAAFSGRDLYFCEPYRPHAWPEKYSLQMDFPIVGLAAIGGALIVCTTGNPYYVVGSHPSSMQADKTEVNQPCINARGIVDLGAMAVYPSAEGLVGVTPAGGVSIITANLFNRHAWRAFSPETIIGGQISGRYVAFYDTIDADGLRQYGGLLIDVGSSPYLIRAATEAAAVHYSVPQSALYYRQTGDTDIFEFDSPNGSRETLYWRSKEFLHPVPINYGAILIDSNEDVTGEELDNLATVIAEVTAENAALIAAGPLEGEIGGDEINELAINGDLLESLPSGTGAVTVGVIADGKRVAQVGVTGRIVRLPAGFTARTWELDVSSNIQVRRIVMGKTVADIQQVTG